MPAQKLHSARAEGSNKRPVEHPLIPVECFTAFDHEGVAVKARLPETLSVVTDVLSGILTKSLERCLTLPEKVHLYSGV